MSGGHLGYVSFPVRHGVVLHDPAAVEELDLPRMHERAELIAHGGRRRGVVPPLVDPKHLDAHEPPCRILAKSMSGSNFAESRI